MRIRLIALLSVAALMTLGISPMSSVTAASGPGITVSPSSAKPGATVTVTGSGFAGDCGVVVYWDSTDGAVLGAGKVAADGSVSTKVKLPDRTPAGSATVVAAGRSFGQAGCASDSGKTAKGSVTMTEAASPYGFDVALANRMVRGARGVDAAVLNAARGSSKSIHGIVQLNALPRAGDLAALAAAGITPLAYLNSPAGIGTAYLASLKPSFGNSPLVRSVAPLTTVDKIEVGLAAALGGAAVETTVLFWSDVSVADADALLASTGIKATRKSGDTVIANLNRDQVLALAGSDIVQFLARRSPAGLYELDTSRNMINVDEVQDLDTASGTYLGLSGLGVQISIHDSGVDDHHNDFDGRMLNSLHQGTGNTDDHGTHVASIAAGSGAMSNQNDDANNPNNGTAFQWRGMAPQAGIAAFGSRTGDDAATMADAINNESADVSNHSYGYTADGVYDADMADIDDIIRGDAGAPARPAVYSAGNGGTNAQFGNNSGYFALTKSCKNCIMVANLEDTTAAGVTSLNGGSSQGPTPDGRVKPDLAANGTTVIAAEADIPINTGNGYIQMGGTSMATPAITGSIALLLQQYGEQFGVDINTAAPLPSTLKAILIQTATDLAGTATGTNPDTGAGTAYGAGPDWATGYGMANIDAASNLMAAEMFLEDSVATTNVTDTHLASVAPGQAELRITLAWDDLPGTPNANHAAPSLVNDLDLLLVGPNGEVVRPLVLPAVQQFDCDADSSNGTQTQCASPGADPGPWGGVAAQGTDRRNNVEQAIVANPAPGTWRARVSVLNTDSTVRLPLGGEQSYSLAGLSDARADLRITKSSSPDPATAGEQLFYNVTVHNDGPDDATNVGVVDVLPAGVTYVTNDLPGGCVQAPPGTLTCSVGNIAAGTSKSFTIKVAIDPALVADNGGPLTIFNTASVWSQTVDDDISDNSATDGTIVEDRADLEVAKMCKPDRPLLAGETGHCTIFVDNHGPSSARDVRVENVMLSDAAFSIANITASQGTCGGLAAVDGGKKFVCDLGDLAAASSSEAGRATIFYEVSATEAADINDRASASSDTPDPDNTNDSATEHIAVTAVADLSITKTGPSSAVAGTSATYSLSITNDGPSTARGVVITDALPAGVQILSVTGSNGATCNAGVPGVASQPTVCSYGDLAPAATRTMSIEVKILPGTRGVIHNDARVDSATFDSDLSDNLATVATDVTGSADLAVTKSSSPDPVVAGNPLTYTITVTNNGPSTATDVTITDTIPDGTTFVSGVDGNGTTVCALLQVGTVVCELGDMAPGATTTVYLTVQVAASVPDGTVLANSVTVSSTTPDPTPGNNTAGDNTDVTTSAELWIDKQAVRRSGNPSPIVEYTIVVHNNDGCETDAQSTVTPTCGSGGPSDAQDVVVTDQLPLDPKKFVVQYVSPQCTYTKATHSLSCTIGTLPAGVQVSFVVEAQVAGSVGTITNTASIASSATPDPVTTNNQNTVTLVMKGGTGKR